MRPLFLSLLALLAIGSVRADDCVRSRAVYSTYIAPSVVAVPTYAYTTNYAYQQTLLVPQVLEVATYAPNHVYSISSEFQAAQFLDAVTRHDKEIRDSLQQGQPTGQLPQQPPPQPVQAPPVAPVPQPVQQPAVQPRASMGPVRPSAFQDANLIALIQSKCVKCHSPGSKRLQLLTTDGKGLADLSRLESLTTYWMVNTGAMPKTTEPVDPAKPEVPDSAMPLFAKWIEASK